MTKNKKKKKALTYKIKNQMTLENLRPLLSFLSPSLSKLFSDVVFIDFKKLECRCMTTFSRVSL